MIQIFKKRMEIKALLLLQTNQSDSFTDGQDHLINSGIFLDMLIELMKLLRSEIILVIKQRA